MTSVLTLNVWVVGVCGAECRRGLSEVGEVTRAESRLNADLKGDMMLRSDILDSSNVGARFRPRRTVTSGRDGDNEFIGETASFFSSWGLMLLLGSMGEAIGVMTAFVMIVGITIPGW